VCCLGKHGIRKIVMSEPSICLTGEWTIHVIAQHKSQLSNLLESGQCNLDMSDITELDSAGLQLLLSARRSLEKRGKEICLTPISPVVKNVLSIYGLDINLHALPQDKEMP